MHKLFLRRAAVCCITAAFLATIIGKISYVSASSDKSVGETKISGGRAVVFTDSSGLTVHEGDVIPERSQEAESNVSDRGNNAVSGNDLEIIEGGDKTPEGRIGAWTNYRNPDLTAYEFPEGVTGIGDFSFARSGLESVTIPETVKGIGYAAFYHCDSLQNITIPETVEQIEAYAFDYTPWLKNWKNDDNSEDYLIVGDGILIAYKGKQNNIMIPDGVKRIGPYVFEALDDITEVFFPETLEIVDEAAFLDCKNLSRISWGGKERIISDRAFCNTSVKDLEIPGSVVSIGLRAFDYRNSILSSEKRKVVFQGENLPVQQAEKASMRLANREARENAFIGFSTAVIGVNANPDGTVIDQEKSGYRGKIENTSGQVLYEAREEMNTEPGIFTKDLTGFLGNISYEFEEVTDRYLIKADTGNAYNDISVRYALTYQGSLPSDSICFDLTMTEERLGTPILRLGNIMKLTVELPPSLIRNGVLSMYTVNEQGKLEKLPCSLTETEGIWKLTFKVTHFSPFCISLVPDESYETETRVVSGQAFFTESVPSGNGVPRIE